MWKCRHFPQPCSFYTSVICELEHFFKHTDMNLTPISSLQEKVCRKFLRSKMYFSILFVHVFLVFFSLYLYWKFSPYNSFLLHLFCSKIKCRNVNSCNVSSIFSKVKSILCHTLESKNVLKIKVTMKLSFTLSDNIRISWGKKCTLICWKPKDLVDNFFVLKLLQ